MCQFSIAHTAGRNCSFALSRFGRSAGHRGLTDGLMRAKTKLRLTWFFLNRQLNYRPVIFFNVFHYFGAYRFNYVRFCKGNVS